MIDKVTFKDKNISRLGLGTMRLPCKSGEKRESSGDIDYKEACEIVDYAVKNGVNYFDTAYMYHCGKSENFIGYALKKYPRSSIYLADKLPIWMCDNADDVQKIFNDQLKKCQVDYFDFYLLHSLDKGNYEKCEKFGAYDFIAKMKKEGKIKNIGFSFHGTINDLEKIVSDHEWDFAQIQLNYLDWNNQRADEQYEILTNAHIPVVVMEPVRGGKLAAPGKEVESLLKSVKPDKSIASWAISFAASHKNVLTVLSGMNSIEQLSDNITTLTDFKPFGEEEYSVCSKAAEILNKNDIIPCTGCDYCSDCPQGVKISSIFSVYNKYKSGEISREDSRKLYSDIDIKHDSCINCKKCTTHCPQGINIPSKLSGEIKHLFS